MRCAVLPQIGGRHPDGFIDTGSELPGRGDQWDEHVYVSVVAVREMARLIGWYPPEHVTDLEQRLVGMADKLSMVEAERDHALSVVGAVDVIESEGFRRRKKAGRPSKEAVT